MGMYACEGMDKMLFRKDAVSSDIFRARPLELLSSIGA